MKMSFILIFLAGCTPAFELMQSEKTTIIPPLSYKQMLAKDFSLALTMQGEALSASQLKKRLVLIKDPQHEMLDGQEHTLSFTLKKHASQETVEMKPKALSANTHYGVYYRDDPKTPARLIYTFFTVKKPELISHDLGAKAPFFVDNNRKIFSFSFDQPVFAQHDAAMRIIALDDEKAPAMAFLTIFPQQNTVVARLKDEDGKVFVPGKHYRFLFDGFSDADANALVLEPLDMMAIAPSLKLPIVKPTLLVAHDFIEIKWLSDVPHGLQVLVWGQAQSSFLRTTEQKMAQRLLQHNLMSEKEYEVAMVSEYSTGQISLAQGRLNTRAVKRLKIAEIMVNPLLSDAFKKADGEYIEIANTSNEPISLENLRISIEDAESFKVVSCDLLDKMSLDKNERFLLVSQDFRLESYELSPAVTIVRLPQKTLCGGLSNNKKKIIRLEEQDGSVIDRYGAYKWLGKKGLSINRIDLFGLDEENNYCYSDAKKGPTPGQASAACGT